MGKHRRVVPLIPIASPLAGHRLTKRIGQLINQCAEQKKLVYGVKDTAKLLKKNEQGICVLGGNVSPMDVITHIPAICENQDVPYVFLPTKEQISAYAQRTSPVACVVIRAPEDGDDRSDYDSVLAEIEVLRSQPPDNQE
jgi:H/ACA ribonucleoprotein complex subunit 2